jgi:hypothetical protein
VRKGYGDAVVTEDSDLIVVRLVVDCQNSSAQSVPSHTPKPNPPTQWAQYAALAPTPFPILFKLDATGACVELTYDPAELSSRQGKPRTWVGWLGW